MEYNNTIEKVKQEMISAERMLSELHQSWTETLTACYSENLQKISEWEISEIQKECRSRINLSGTNLPIYKSEEYLISEYYKNHDINANVVEWHNMISHTGNSRDIVFCNDGNINFSKENLSGIGYSYKINYNVNSDNFIMNIGNKTTNKEVNYKISMCENKLEFSKVINGNSLIVYKYIIDEKFNVDNVVMQILTYKSNGKINGQYNMSFNNNGIEASFISRKGKKVDLIKTGILGMLQTKVGLPESVNDNDQDLNIISGINFSEKEINLDLKEFNDFSIHNIKNEITDLLKQLIGEIPLFGLKKRLNLYINKLTIANYDPAILDIKSCTRQKVLKKN